MATYVFSVLGLCILCRHVFAYEFGAPCAAQDNLHPSSVYHGESRNLKTNPPPFRFSIADFDDLDVKTYTPGREYFSKLFLMFFLLMLLV